MDQKVSIPIISKFYKSSKGGYMTTSLIITSSLHQNLASDEPLGLSMLS